MVAHIRLFESWCDTSSSLSITIKVVCKEGHCNLTVCLAEGYRLTNAGYDCLALKYFVNRDVLTGLVAVAGTAVADFCAVSDQSSVLARSQIFTLLPTKTMSKWP